MKLFEIVRTRPDQTVTLKIEPADGRYGEIDVEVGFDYTPAGYSQHAPDNYTFRERHAAGFDISFIRLLQDVYELDDEGAEIGQPWKKGTDARELPGWETADFEYVLDKLSDEYGAGGNSDADDDHYLDYDQ